MGQKEIHEGCIVRDNADPEKRGRLIVECPTIVTGESMGDWMEPIFNFVDSVNSCGTFFVPSVGSIVSVEIETGSEAQVNGLVPKWRCDIYPIDTVPDEFKENYPERRGWKTRSGHVMYFDDTEGQRVFQYTHPTGVEVYVDNDGNVTVHTLGADTIRLGSYGVTEHAVLGDAFFNHLEDMIEALRTYANDPMVQQVPGVQSACVSLVAACLAFVALLPSDLSVKVVLE